MTQKFISNRSLAAISIARIAIFFISTVWASLTLAGGDASDGHGHGAAPVTASSQALPRFSAQSDLFEAVGILTGAELSIFIDRYANNEPVLGAKIEIESGSVKTVAEFHADHGDYSVPSAPFQKPGTYPITLTVNAGDQTDLLVGELVVPDPQSLPNAASATHGWQKWLGWAVGLLVLILATLFAAHKIRARRRAYAAT
ncbi:MAG: hypothetical protein ACKVIH_08810 [Burkholderiales bacterium]